MAVSHINSIATKDLKIIQILANFVIDKKLRNGLSCYLRKKEIFFEIVNYNITFKSVGKMYRTTKNCKGKSIIIS